MTTSRDAKKTILTKGSLCTGIGALDAATPGEVQWVAETNEAAARVLKREHPAAVNLGDITAPGLCPPAVDLVTSGDPCQSMSAAGRQLASKDERFLWPDVIRLIERVRPGHVFLENVQNIVSVPLFPGAERGTVLALRLDDLRRAGYEVRWMVMGACAVGAPHHRHRWFLRARWFGFGAPPPERVGVKAICGAPRSGGRVLLPTPITSDGAGPGNTDGRSFDLRTAVARLLPTPMSADHKGPGKSRDTPWDNLPSAVHHMLPTPAACSGDARGNPSPEHAARRIADPKRSTNLEDAIAARLLPTLRATDGTNGGPAQRGSRGDLAMGSACQPEVWGQFAEAVALWEAVTGVPAPDPTEPAPRGGRRLNAQLAEWMMGYPIGYLTSEMNRNQALRAAGNGVVARQAAAAWELLGDGW